MLDTTQLTDEELEIIQLVFHVATDDFDEDRWGLPPTLEPLIWEIQENLSKEEKKRKTPPGS